MIAMSRCGAICLMVGGPTPQGRGHTDAPDGYDDDEKVKTNYIERNSRKVRKMGREIS